RLHSAGGPDDVKLAGTIGYIAPECLEGSPADERSDLFSFGVLLYEMATGALPFHASGNTKIIQRVLADEPRPLRELRPDLPDSLQSIVAKLLEKRPEDRYARAEDVARALRTARPSSL